MSPSDIITRFGFAEDEFFPGSKRRRDDPNPELVKRRALSEQIWDEHPRVTHVNGTKVDMFTIGDFAKALGTTVYSIRSWEKKGYIPGAPFRLPAVQRAGMEQKNRRLYARANVVSAVEAFAARGLIAKPRIDWNSHRDLVDVIFNAWTAYLNTLTNTNTR